MKSTIDDKCFHDERTAYAWVESLLWPYGPICPHCGGVDRISPMKGKSTRIGTYKCYQCRKPFTVKVGTIFESSHVPLRYWLQAMFLLASSKKGISANQLARTLGCTLKTGWFIGHRIREAMKATSTGQLGGSGKIVEVDETFFVNKKDAPIRTGFAHKMAVMSLVERGGPIRSVVLDHVNRQNVERIIRRNVHHDSRLMTDAAAYYKARNRFGIAEHEKVNHDQGEYVHGDVHVNTLESYFSTFKRGMKGTYQHCSEKHLHRYVSEFDFRYNNRAALGVNDAARTEAMVRGIVGRRLTFR